MKVQYDKSVQLSINKDNYKINTKINTKKRYNN